MTSADLAVGDPAPPVSARFLATSQLMQNYRLAKPVSAVLQLALAPRPGGDTDVFTVSTAGRLSRIHADPESDTGWSIEDLAFPAAAAAVVAASTDPGGNTVVYASDGAALWSMAILDPQTASWESVEVPDSVDRIAGLKVGYDAGRVPFLVALVTNTPAPGGSLAALALVAGDNWSITNAPLFSIKQNTWAPALVAPVGSTAPQPGACFVAQSLTPPHYSIATCTLGDDPQGGIGCAGMFSMVAAGGQGSLFAVAPIGEQPQGVYYLTANDGGGAYQAAKISDDTFIAAIADGTTADGAAEVFALGVDGTLYYTRQDADSPSGWTTFLPLEHQGAFSHIDVTTNASEASEGYAVATDNSLYRIRQNPLTSDWEIAPIELDDRGDIQSFTSYHVVMTFLDESLVAAPDTELKLFADGPVVVDIAGVAVSLDVGTPWQGTSDAAGQFALAIAVSSLGTANLSVWAGFMPPDDRIALHPWGIPQTTLSSISSDGHELLDATDYYGRPVQLFASPPSTEVLSNVGGALGAAMELANNTATDATAALHPRADPRVAHYAAGAGPKPGMTPLRSLPKSAWQLSLRSGTPAFRRLTQEDADHAEAALLRAPSADPLYALWGEIVDAADDGIAAINECIVKPVTQGISVSVSLTIAGVEYAWTAILNFGEDAVELAFDLVGVVFDAVGVAFDTVVSWLGFLFDWDDMLRTQQVLLHLINQGFNFVQLAAAGLKTQVEQYLAGVSPTLVTDAFNSLTGSTVGQQSLLQVQQTQQQPSVDLGMLQHDIVLGGAADHAAQATAPMNTAPTDVQQNFTALQQLLSQQGTAIQQRSGAAYQNAVDSAKTLMTTPDDFITSAVTTTLGIMDDVATAVIDAGGAVVGTLLDGAGDAAGAVQSVLTEPWDIPFVTDLYQFITEDPDGALNAASLSALVLSVPTTILYKLTTAQAPFPDQNSVDQFCNQISAQTLAQWAGLTAATDQSSECVEPAQLAGDAQQVGKILCACAFLVAETQFGFLEYKVDSIPPGPMPNPLQALLIWIGSAVAWLLELAAQIFACPYFWSASRAAPDPTGNTTAFAAFIWCVEWLEVVYDLLTICCIWRLARLNEDVGALSIAAWGIVHAVLFGIMATRPLDPEDEQRFVNMAIAEGELFSLSEFAKIGRLTMWGEALPATCKMTGIGDWLLDFVAGLMHLIRTGASASPKLQPAPA